MPEQKKIMEAKKIADRCGKHLRLENARLSEEYYYRSLPLCVVDAVFSIGIKYSITRNVVIKFCDKIGIDRLRSYGSTYPPIKEQFSMHSFLDLYEQYGIEEMTGEIFSNRNRTSPRGGILKSQAALAFGNVLTKYGINYFQDLPKCIGSLAFERDIKEIPGHGSGVSISYFYMLAGEDNFIKPDRMILRFIESCIDRKVSASEASTLICRVAETLKSEYKNLTPRLLDYEIWKFQRSI